MSQSMQDREISPPASFVPGWISTPRGEIIQMHTLTEHFFFYISTFYVNIDNMNAKCKKKKKKKKKKKVF